MPIILPILLFVVLYTLGAATIGSFCHETLEHAFGDDDFGLATTNWEDDHGYLLGFFWFLFPIATAILIIEVIVELLYQIGNIPSAIASLFTRPPSHSR